MNYDPFDEFQVVKAGSHYADLVIRLKRDESIQTEERVLTLKLEPTEVLGLGLTGGERFPGCGLVLEEMILMLPCTRLP